MVRDRIIERKHLFQMRTRRGKLTGKHQVPTGGIVAEDEASRVISTTALNQQIIVEADRHIHLAPVNVVPRLPIGDPKELRGRTQLLPQLSCTSIRVA